MSLALEKAKEAASWQEVPIGAVVVLESRVIGAAFNRRELDQQPTAHAEILAIGQAARYLGSWRLCGASLYVTLEPCPMCAGALVNSRIEHLIYGCDDPKAGAVRSLFALCEDPRLNHRLTVTRGVLASQCSEQLSSFFAQLRVR
jgi:tRNA(adenine34) deaminase